MNTELKETLEKGINQIQNEAQTVYSIMIRSAGKDPDEFDSARVRYKSLTGQLDGIKWVLKTMGYTYIVIDDRWQVIPEAQYMHMIGWDAYQ